MKLKTFFEKFDRLADAPDAVAKMRELVWHLGATGKLVGQDPSEESGELLLKRINAERLAAMKARQISPMKPLPLVGEDELLFELQPGWAAARLIELVMEIQTGPFGSSLHKSDYQLGGTPVINPASLKNGKIIPIDGMAIGHTTLERLEVFKLSEGDIVMARRGEMGRCAIVTKNEEGWLCGTGSLVLRMPRSLYAPYLAMLIGAPMARTYLGGASVGTTMQNLNQSILAKMPVGVPPLAEQKRIVAKVDELMALCDRLEAQQQERETQHAALARASLARFAEAPTPASLQFLFHPSYAIAPSDLRKSILTLAVQGKLVPQDSKDDEPEAALLQLHRERIRLAKAGKLRAAKVPTNAFLEDSLPFSPDSWRTVSFDHVAVAHNNALKAGPFGSALKKEFYVEKGYKIYGQEQVIADDPFIGDYYIDEKKFAELESCAVSAGDILISLVGTIGKLLVLPDGIEPGIINPRVIKLSLDASLVYPMFIKVLIGSPYAVDFFEENSHGGTMSILNLSILRALPVPLPPLAEQRRIVAKVEQLMTLVDELETELIASRATAANLLSALVAELTGTARDGKVAAPSVSGAVRRGGPKDFQPKITQIMP